MNYREDIVNVELTTGTIFRGFLNHSIGCGDKKADRFGIRTFRNGSYEAINGDCSGYFIRADGETVVIANGTVSGNMAYVELPEACYAVEGQFTLAIKISGGGATGTLRIVDGVVSRTTTDAVVDPGTLIPSIEDLIDAIDDAVSSIPADYSSLWTSLAPAFSSSTNYVSGRYVTYNGALYRFIRQHTGAWNSNDVEAVSYGNVLPPMDAKIDGGYDQTQKRLVLMDYTLADGVLQTTTGTINTDNVMYKHISCPCTPGNSYYIGGYTYGVNYCAANFLDSDNNIIGHSPVINNTVNWVGTVVAPANATTLVVNCRVDSNSHPMFIYAFEDERTYTQEIGTGIVDAGGAITYDSAWNSTTNAAKSQPENTYQYKTLSISGGERFIIDGFSGSTNYPAVTFQNADGDIIYRMHDTQQKRYGYAVTAPSAARKIIVNGRIDMDIPPVIRKVTNTAPNAFDALCKDACESVAELVSIFPTFTYNDVVITKNGVDSGSNTNTVYYYGYSPVTPGENYYITGWNYSYNYPLYVFVDANGKPCSVAKYNELPGNSQCWRVKTQAPLDAVGVYVNGRKGGTNGGNCDILVAATGTIRDTLKKANVCDLYSVHSPIADLISSAAKSDYYLSRFSSAYAVMLHRIMTTYPNALVICCSCNECERTTSQGLGMPEMNKVGETIADYNAVIELMCKAFGAVFVDHHSCGITYYNIADYLQDYNPETGFGVHPNAAGMALIAAKTIKDLTGYDFTGKKLSVYGDSISTYNGTGSEHNQYPNGDVNNVNKTWWHISMIQHFGMTLLNNGSAGSRSVSTIREGIEGYPKSGVEQDRINNLAVNGVSPDVIIIKQGINDFGNAGSSNNADLNGHYWFGGI